MSNDQAQAVFDALSGAITCDCGVQHAHGTLRSYRPWRDVKEMAPCDCGQSHDVEVYCGCGTTHLWGVKAGWRVIKRKHKCWLLREQQFAARIAELEAQLAQR